jgi:HEAT repeat protein
MHTDTFTIAELKCPANVPQKGGSTDSNWVEGDSLAVETLILALYDRESDITKAAALALGRIGDRRAVAPLAALLTGEDAGVRRAVAWALAWIRDGGAMEALEQGVRDEDPTVREATAEALLHCRQAFRL